MSAAEHDRFPMPNAEEFRRMPTDDLRSFLHLYSVAISPLGDDTITRALQLHRAKWVLVGIGQTAMTWRQPFSNWTGSTHQAHQRMNALAAGRDPDGSHTLPLKWNKPIVAPKPAPAKTRARK